MILRFFEKLRVQPVAPRTSLGELSGKMFASLFNQVLMENRILSTASGEGDLPGPGALKRRLQIIQSRSASTNYRKYEKKIGRLRKSWDKMTYPRQSIMRSSNT